MRKLIYKFFRLNEYFYDLLISNQLYFSSIQQFNDPYDCRIKFPPEVTENDFKLYLENSIESEVGRDKLLHAFRKNPKAFVKPFTNYFQEFLNYYGICCFSAAKSNLLLWSHYADSHQGVSLGFDYQLMTQDFKQFDDINYNDAPFLFDFKDHNNSLAETILRKSKDWQYEEEVRFLVERSKNVGFNMSALLEVNFGARCSNRNMLSIQRLVKKMGYQNCRFYKARIDNSNYAVLFEEVDFDKLKAQVLNESRRIPFKQSMDLKDLL